MVDVNCRLVQKYRSRRAAANPFSRLLRRADDHGAVVPAERGKFLKTSLCQYQIAADDKNGWAVGFHDSLFLFTPTSSSFPLRLFYGSQAAVRSRSAPAVRSLFEGP